MTQSIAGADIRSFAENLTPNTSSLSGTINGGDMVFYDTTNKIAKAVTSDADCLTLIGVSLDTNPTQVYNSEIVNPINVSKKTMVGYTFPAGQVLVMGQAIYFDTNAQQVTQTVGTNAVGYVAFDPSNVGVTTVAGVKYRVVINGKF
jgi:hypothetical protein